MGASPVHDKTILFTMDSVKSMQWSQMLIKLLCGLGWIAIMMLFVWLAYELVDLGREYCERNRKGF